MATTTSDEKIKNIKKIVDELANKQAEKLIASAKARQEQELIAQKELLASQSAVQLREVGSKESKAKMQAILERQAASKRDLIGQRSEIESRVFEAVLKRLEEYVGSAEYIKTEAEKLKALKARFAGGNTTIYSRAQDLEKFKGLAQEIWGQEALVVATENICLGGFILINEGKGIAQDMTLDSAVQKEKKAFYSTAKLEIV